MAIRKGTAGQFQSLPPDQVAEIQRRALAGHKKTEVARALGVGEKSVQKYWPKNGESKHGRVTARGDGESMELEVPTAGPVRTLEDAIAAANVDQSVWYVDRWEATAWTVGMKVRRGQNQDTGRWLPEKPIQTQQHGVKLWLKRIVKKSIGDALDLVFKRFEKSDKKWPRLAQPKARGESFLAAVGLMDIHFGKLAWIDETGESYDLKIAERMYANALDDMMAEWQHRTIDRFLFPVGNDWMHFDDRENRTTRGTTVESDGRFSKVFATAILAATNAVLRMAATAPVDVVLVAGNHDRSMAECLCHVLKARFHDSDRVTVDVSPKTRKYYRWHNTLIGLAHGDLVPAQNLQPYMSADAKTDWAETVCHEWLTGHGHRSQKWTGKDVDSQPGVVIRQLRALTKTDRWHFDHGFTSGAPGAELYWYGKANGYSGHAVAHARTEAA